MYLMNQDYEVALYYLYMLSDEQLSLEEKDIFQGICSTLDPRHSSEEIISYCNGLGRISSFAKIKGMELAENISRYYSSNDFGSSSYSSNDFASSFYSSNDFGSSSYRGHLIDIIWNLIELGKSDGNYSRFEKEIVEYLVSQWGISEVIYKELLDCARTVDALENYKQWLVQSCDDESFALNEMKKLDNQLKEITWMLKSLGNEFVICA